MSIDKHLNQLCITIPGKGQAIVVQFEEKRDFSVTICLLQKSDLHVSDSIPSVPSATSTAFNSSSHGPQLTSITPMTSLSSPPQTFGAGVLPVMDSHIHPALQPMPHQLHPQQTASVPIYSSPSFPPSIPPDMAHLNPHNMFPGRNTNMHIPRVASPLRHSFCPEAQLSSTLNAGSVSDWFSPIISQSPINVEGFHTTVNPIPMDREKPQVDTSHSPKAGSQWPQSESDDFRDLMPQPRKLPFQSRPKRSILQPDTIVRDEVQKLGPQAKRVKGVPNKTTSNKEVRQFKTQGSQTIDIGVNIPMQSTSAPLPNRLTPQSMPEEIPNTGARDAECQTEMPAYTNASQQVYQLQFPVADPTVLIASPDVLRELDEATASLFEQYETDVANGRDSQLCAEFYLNQIYSKRRDFWLAKLEELAAGQWQWLSS